MNRCLRGRVSVAKPPPTLENSSSAVADETCGLARKFHHHHVGSLVPWRVVIGI
jgi:hypothetical protein